MSRIVFLSIMPIQVYNMPLGSRIGTGLSVPCRSGTPTYKPQVNIRSGTCTHTPPHALQHRTLPPSQGGLRGCHMPYGSRPHLPARERSGASHVLWLRTLPNSSRGLRCCGVYRSSRPHLPTREGSAAATCPTTLDPTSLLGRAPHATTRTMALDLTSRVRWARTLPHALRLWTSPPS
jgi:hypothetical protein